MNQLKLGIKVESEHKQTVDYIRAYYQKHGRMPPNIDVYKQIAKNHLSEDPKYYSKLMKAKL